MRLPDVGQHAIHVGLSLAYGDARSEPTDNAKPVIAARRAKFFRYAQRRVNDVGHAERESKAGLHHADYSVGEAVDTNGPAENAGIAAEILLPHFVAQHRDIVAPILFLARNEGAPDERLRVQYIEEVIAGGGVAQVQYLRPGVEVDALVRTEASQVLERMVLLALVQIARPR